MDEGVGLLSGEPSDAPQRLATRRGAVMFLLAGVALCGAALYGLGPAARAANDNAAPIGLTALEREGRAVQDSKCIDQSGPVLRGVDVVAYRSIKSGFVKGKEAHAALLNGFTFWFESEENKEAFEADPWRYSPAWGGFCSWGIAKEDWWTKDTVGPWASPSAWLIVQDRLFMFRTAGSPESLFQEDMEAHIAMGDARWAGWWAHKPEVVADGDHEDADPRMHAGAVQTGPFNNLCVCAPLPGVECDS